MREAVGGSLLFMIILTFLGVYIIFIGVIINYAATYRASNYALTRLEQTEGKIQMTGGVNATTSTLCEEVKSKKYYNDLSVCCMNQSNGAIFKITTVVKFNIPVVDYELPLYVNNETKTIYGISCSDTVYPTCSEGALRCS